MGALRSPGLRSPTTPALLRRSRRHQAASQQVDNWAERLASATRELERVLHESAELGATVESLSAVVAALHAAGGVGAAARVALDASSARLRVLRENEARRVLAELFEVLDKGALVAQCVHAALEVEGEHADDFGALGARAQDVAITASLFRCQLREVVGGGDDASGYSFDIALGGALRDGALPLLHAVAKYVSAMLGISSRVIFAAAPSIAERLDNPQSLQPRILVDEHLTCPFALGPRVLTLLKRLGGLFGQEHEDMRSIDALLVTLREQEERERERCAVEQAARQGVAATSPAEPNAPSHGKHGRHFAWIPAAWRRRVSLGGGVDGAFSRLSLEPALGAAPSRTSMAECERECARLVPHGRPAHDPSASAAPARVDGDVEVGHVRAQSHAQPAPLSPPRAPQRTPALGSSAKRRLSASARRRSDTLKRHLSGLNAVLAARSDSPSSTCAVRECAPRTAAPERARHGGADANAAVPGSGARRSSMPHVLGEHRGQPSASLADVRLESAHS
ncbi:hypothetical protein KFE25_013586 [Diacronema lutheri]|uniref:Uncharacterized protein n=1 Tax=Diacronema lutheri TaxID=2081491 RepID=A0A8J6CI71_DIALT|nr:hypothetical protein KFE25_013586 [Diacronema lutheri]